MIVEALITHIFYGKMNGMVEIRNCFGFLLAPSIFLSAKQEQGNFIYLFIFCPQVFGQKIWLENKITDLRQLFSAYALPILCKKYLVGLQKVRDILYSKIMLLKFVILARR